MFILYKKKNNFLDKLEAPERHESCVWKFFDWQGDSFCPLLSLDR